MDYVLPAPRKVREEIMLRCDAENMKDLHIQGIKLSTLRVGKGIYFMRIVPRKKGTVNAN